MSIVARNDQQVTFALVFEDKFGNTVTNLGSVPAWSVGDDNLATIEVAEDGFSAVVKSTGKAGTTQVSVLVDSDPGTAEEALVGTAEVTFVAGKAVFVRLTGVLSDAVVTPVEPETPEVPETPETPEVPEVPETPVEPTDPEPTTPAEPEAPGATAEPAPGATGEEGTVG